MKKRAVVLLIANAVIGGVITKASNKKHGIIEEHKKPTLENFVTKVFGYSLVVPVAVCTTADHIMDKLAGVVKRIGDDKHA